MSVVRLAVVVVSVAMLALASGCSHEKRDWHSAQAADTIEAYEQFVKEHPKSARLSEAQGRVAQLNEERDWQRATSTDTADAYRQFLAAHPQAKSAQEARIRIENFAMSGGAAGAPPAPAATAPQTAAAVPSASAALATVSVQLGAFSTRARAQNQWRRLSARFPTELKGAVSQIERGKSSHGRWVYRLRAVLQDESSARALCASLKKHAQACVVSPPQR